MIQITRPSNTTVFTQDDALYVVKVTGWWLSRIVTGRGHWLTDAEIAAAVRQNAKAKGRVV